MILSEKLKALRLKVPMNQTMLARESGVSQAEISRIESGARTNLKIETVVGLARALGVMVDELLEEEA